jgi:hypothetical protein
LQASQLEPLLQRRQLAEQAAQAPEFTQKPGLQRAQTVSEEQASQLGVAQGKQVSAAAEWAYPELHTEQLIAEEQLKHEGGQSTQLLPLTYLPTTHAKHVVELEMQILQLGSQFKHYYPLDPR